MRASRIPIVLLSLALLLTGSLLLTACGATGSAQAGPKVASGEAGAAFSERTLPAGTVDFKAKSLDGEAFNGATALAGKPTVIWFWAPACAACRAAAPDVQTFSARYGQQVAFLGVAGPGTTAQLAKFVSDTGLGGFEHLVDVNGNIGTRFGVSAKPAFAFVSAAGSVRVVAGTLTDEQLNQLITEVAQP